MEKLSHYTKMVDSTKNITVARKILSKDISEEEFELFSKYIENHSGLHIGTEKSDTLRISLHARATKTGVKSYLEYMEIIKNNDQEFKELLSLITINETYFFRYPEQFEVLKTIIIPELTEAKEVLGEKKLRVWSAGCSTGEEPFSLAITILESLPDWHLWDIQILGTDVSKKALEKAMKGQFSKGSFRITRSEILEKYFEEVSSESWRIKDEVKSKVSFIYHNLIKEPYPLAFLEAWDIIFCRNVTIYFKPESTRRVVSNLYKSLMQGGYFFIGHSETLYDINPGFETKKYGDIFVYKKPKEIIRNIQKQTQRERTVQTHVNRDAPRPLAVEGVIEEARSLHLKGKREQAIKKIDEELKKYKEVGGNERLYFYKAFILLSENRVEEARKLLEKTLYLNPLSPEAHYLEGIALRKSGLLEKSLDAFKKAAYLNSDFAPSLIEVGNIYYQLGKFEQAVKYYQRAAETLKRIQGKDFLDFSAEEMREFLEYTCQVMIERIKEQKRAR